MRKFNWIANASLFSTIGIIAWGIWGGLVSGFVNPAGMLTSGMAYLGVALILSWPLLSASFVSRWCVVEFSSDRRQILLLWLSGILLAMLSATLIVAMAILTGVGA